MNGVRLALRSLRRAPAYSVAAITALALGIGANTSLFSMIEATLLRASPYPQAEQLVMLQEKSKTFAELTVSYPDFVDWRAQSGAQFSGMAAWHRESFTLTGAGDPDRVAGRMVSSGFFELLGSKAQLGRFFQPADDAAGAPRTVVLSNSLWQRRFGSDPRVVGQRLQLSGESYTVIGVAPPGFRFFSPQDLFVPIGLWSDQFHDRDTHPGIGVIGRLRPGITVEQARAAMDAIAVRLEKEYPKSNTDQRVSLKTLREVETQDFRLSLLVLWGAVGLVLLVAAANVANLALARAAARAPEIAIRSALGAGRARLMRELLTESVLLSVIGGSLGVLLAHWGLAALLPLVPESLRLAEVKLNGPVLVFTLGLSVVTGLAFGALPALRASTPNLDAMLRESHSTDSHGRRRLRGTLVVAEIALALMLLIGAGLLMRSFAKASGVDLGFQPRGLAVFELSLPERRYPDGAAEIRFEQELRQRLQALPGVKAVAVSPGAAPVLGDSSTGGFWIDGRERPPAGKSIMSYRYDATPGFLAAMGGRLLRGRDLRESDDAKRPAILVDDAWVRTFFRNGEDPIGRYVDFASDTSPHGFNQAEIVGVYGRMEQYGPGSPDPIQAGMIVPFSWSATLSPQWFRGLLVLIRAEGDVQPLIAAARREVSALDPEAPIYGVRTMEAAVGDELANRRFSLLLLGLFAGVALVLAAVGVYGVMSYGVVQRTREIGIRMALGARREDVLRLVVRDGARLAVIGAGIGLCLSAALARVLRELLYGVSAFDPLSYGVLTLVLVLTALAASWLPARRASRMDPQEALRE